MSNMSFPKLRDHLAQLDADPRAAADLFRLLGNGHRLQVLCALRTGELSVGQLIERVELSQSALSQHLARLRAEGAVATRREGQTIYYRVPDADLLSLLAAVAEMFEHRRKRGR